MTITIKCPTRTARGTDGRICEMIRGGPMAVITGDGIPEAVQYIRINGKWFIAAEIVGQGFPDYLETNWNKPSEQMEFL